MKCQILLLLWFLFSQISIAQQTDCNCINDLDFLVSKMNDAVSFKSQITDQKSLDRHVEEIKAAINQDENIGLNCLAYLQKYLTIVKDNHLYIIDQKTDVDYSHFFTTVNKFDELRENASLDPKDELTGVYNLLSMYKVAVIKEKDGQYNGIILETTNNKWLPGQTKFILNKQENTIEGVFYDGLQRPKFVKIEYKNGRLYPERWIKESQQDLISYDPYKMDDDKFQYKKLNATTHYVRLGSFSGMNGTYKSAGQLLDIMEKEITSGNIILDLRNNGGGGPRTSDLFKKYFKKRKDDLSIYVIQNLYCGSDCEQFLLKLKDQQTIKAFGENTKGALAYGFGNYSSPSFETPCYGFTFGITTVKYEQYLQYEIIGIAPDVYLNFKEDWIQQVLHIIENQKP